MGGGESDRESMKRKEKKEEGEMGKRRDSFIHHLKVGLDSGIRPSVRGKAYALAVFYYGACSHMDIKICLRGRVDPKL